MADHLKTLACGNKSSTKKMPKWGLVSKKTTWGGYISDTLNQTNTNASFAHYTLSSSSNNTYATAEWVGNGGYNPDPTHNNDTEQLLQGGVDLSDREMWWEAIDFNGNLAAGTYDPTGFKGTVGDLYDTEVVRISSNTWEVLSENITRGHGLDSGTQHFSPGHTTAEWVMEWQGLFVGAGYIPSFTSVPYTDVWWKDINNTQRNVTYASTYIKTELDYVEGGGSCVKPGTVTNDTSTYSHFTDPWANSGC